MKKTICRAGLLLLCLSMTLTTAFTAVPQDTQTTEKVYYADGSCMEITTTVYASLQRSSSKYTTRDYTYTDSSGNKIFTYTLKAWFSYDSKTSSATDAASTTRIFKSGWTLESSNEYCSGSTAYGSATFSGPGTTRTVNGSISCDKNGNIS